MDKDKRVLGSLAATPDDPTFQTVTIPGVEAALRRTVDNLEFGDSPCLPTIPDGDGENGAFTTASIGVSFGGPERVRILLVFHVMLTQPSAAWKS